MTLYVRMMLGMYRQYAEKKGEEEGCAFHHVSRHWLDTKTVSSDVDNVDC